MKNRKIKISMTLVVTEEHFQEDYKELKDDILSGKMQRYMEDEDQGVLKCTMTAEEIK